MSQMYSSSMLETVTPSLRKCVSGAVRMDRCDEAHCRNHRAASAANADDLCLEDLVDQLLKVLF